MTLIHYKTLRVSTNWTQTEGQRQIYWNAIIHRRSQGGAEGVNSPSQDAQKVHFNKNVVPNFYFSAQKPAREAYSGQECPPKKSAPSKTNSWLHLCNHRWLKWDNYMMQLRKKHESITVINKHDHENYALETFRLKTSSKTSWTCNVVHILIYNEKFCLLIGWYK